MATTTNYGWTTPDDTALVKDGASAIRTLGSSVDTTTKALNPETTLGDISYRSSTANVKTRLALGTAGQILKVNSGATAPEWATPASAGGMTLLSTTTFSTATTTLSSFGGYKSLKLIMYGFAWTSTDAPLNIRPNGSNVNNYITGVRGTTTYSIINGAMNMTDVDWNRNESNHVFVINFDNYTDTSMNKSFDFHGYFIQPPASNEKTPLVGAGVWLNTAAITSLEIRLAGTVYQGTALLYGVN
jgi:hypothetical protein